MLTTPGRSTFTLAESARIRNGSITLVHGWACATHRGGECGCSPSYTLRRQPRRKAVRR